MDGLTAGSDIREAESLEAQKKLGDNSTGGDVFDASQYAFFGKDILEEVELGGLEDEECLTSNVLDEEEFFYKEAEDIRSVSEIDDLASTFSKLTKVGSGLISTGLIGEHGSSENSSVAEWPQREDVSNLFGQHMFEAASNEEGKRWSSQPYHSVLHQQESKLHRTSSYPDPQQKQPHHHQHFDSEPVLLPTSAFTPHPQLGGRPQEVSPNQNSGYLSISYHSGGPKLPLSSPNPSHFSGSQIRLAGLNHGSHFGGNMRPFASSPPLNNQLSNQWINQANLHHGDHPSPLNNILQQQLPIHNGPVPPHLITQLQQQQYRLLLSAQASGGYFPGLQSQLSNSHLAPASPLMSNYDHIIGLTDMRDQRSRSVQNGRQNFRFSQQGFDIISGRSESGWPLFRSNYMTTDEIEGIIRMQLVATHNNDPYVDDYYHQACLAKKSSESKLKHHFCPSQLRELPPHARANSEPHAFLQVDALGRVPFSSVRRPRPLLEVDPPNTSVSGGSEQTVSQKPLEQEPMLAARVTIEDGICLLLDVDDIDRFLKFNLLQDGGIQLRQRRQALLEGLAASLHLVDPLGKNGNAVGIAAKDDCIFLRLVSLSKGQKLVARYLQLLYPGGDLTRVVCMAIFRHLRFLFGSFSSNPTTSETSKLAKVVAQRVQGMDLCSLSACLAAVVCSSEQPPLRPLGSSAGEEASLILISLLDRATELLTDPHAASNYNVANRSLWQASFDEFFTLLSKYCVNKYEGILQSLLQAAPNVPAITSDVARAVSKEMPVELLRASLPHTDDSQRKLLMDFAQRSVPVAGFNSNSGGSGGHMNCESLLI